MNAVANVAGILLAAGRGRRFDPLGTRNKLLQPLPSGEPVVVASARNLLSVLPRVIAVVPPQDGGVADALRALGCEVTLCAEADSGMAASLVQGITSSLPQADAWLVALGDMPYVAASTCARCSMRWATGQASRPRCSRAAAAIRWPSVRCTCRRCWRCRASTERALY
jgi:molybdenum cofactor cytidylyltransferase